MEENIKIGRFVLDASYVLAAIMPDEHDNKAIQTLIDYQKKKNHLITTNLLPYEVLNSLRNNVLRKRISFRQAELLYTEFFRLEIPQMAVDLNMIFELSINNNISCYDAAYLALARQEDAQLLTFDDRLKNIL